MIQGYPFPKEVEMHEDTGCWQEYWVFHFDRLWQEYFKMLISTVFLQPLQLKSDLESFVPRELL